MSMVTTWICMSNREYLHYSVRSPYGWLITLRLSCCDLDQNQTTP